MGKDCSIKYINTITNILLHINDYKISLFLKHLLNLAKCIKETSIFHSTLANLSVKSWKSEDNIIC